MKRLRSMLVVAPGLLALPVACADKPATAVVLALSSEASLPKEIDSVTILVTRGSDVRFSRTYEADKETNTIKLPGTLSIQPREDEDPKQAIKVQILGNLKGQQVVVRTATTSFVEEKQKLLRLNLRYSCVDVPQLCGEGQTCIGGRCAPDLVAPESLPDLPADTELFPTRGAGACFDMSDASDANCARELEDLPLACEFDLGEGGKGPEKLNLFAFWSSKVDQAHPLVLDGYSEEGWQAGSSPTKIRLSEGLCEAVKQGRIRKLGYTRWCETKRESQPVCRPREGETKVEKFFENACHKCVYHYQEGECSAHLQKAKASAVGTEERKVIDDVEACEFDGAYNSLDECGAVKGCFYSRLAPMLECQGEGCKKYENLVKWGQCLNQASAKTCTECGATGANTAACNKK